MLNKIDEIKNIGDAYMITMDVESLYTNIDHKEGLEAIQHFLQMRDEPFPPTDFIVELTRWTLENNIFLFQEQLYRQTRGTAMGVTYAPSYANLFLGVWEDKIHLEPCQSLLG